MDEHKLLSEAARASQAKGLLENDLLKEAFETLEQAYIAAWRATTIDNVMAREKLFIAINVIGKFRDHLTSVLSSGKLADAELAELVKLSERKKRFGII